MTDERPRLTIVMNDAARAIIEKTAERNGFSGQVDQTIEECAELIVALRHYERGREAPSAVLDEMGDVLMMIAAMCEHLGSCEEHASYNLELLSIRLKRNE